MCWLPSRKVRVYLAVLELKESAAWASGGSVSAQVDVTLS
jgi:hypothetical protein